MTDHFTDFEGLHRALDSPSMFAEEYSTSPHLWVQNVDIQLDSLDEVMHTVAMSEREETVVAPSSQPPLYSPREEHSVVACDTPVDLPVREEDFHPRHKQIANVKNERPRRRSSSGTSPRPPSSSGGVSTLRRSGSSGSIATAASTQEPPPPKTTKSKGDTKERHKYVEKKRRDRISEQVEVLRKLLPGDEAAINGLSKVSVLVKTAEYLTSFGHRTELMLHDIGILRGLSLQFLFLLRKSGIPKSEMPVLDEHTVELLGPGNVSFPPLASVGPAARSAEDADEDSDEGEGFGVPAPLQIPSPTDQPDPSNILYMPEDPLVSTFGPYQMPSPFGYPPVIGDLQDDPVDLLPGTPQQATPSPTRNETSSPSQFFASPVIAPPHSPTTRQRTEEADVDVSKRPRKRSYSTPNAAEGAPRSPRRATTVKLPSPREVKTIVGTPPLQTIEAGSVRDRSSSEPVAKRAPAKSVRSSVLLAVMVACFFLVGHEPTWARTAPGAPGARALLHQAVSDACSTVPRFVYLIALVWASLIVASVVGYARRSLRGVSPQRNANADECC